MYHNFCTAQIKTSENEKLDPSDSSIDISMHSQLYIRRKYKLYG